MPCCTACGGIWGETACTVIAGTFGCSQADGTGAGLAGPGDAVDTATKLATANVRNCTITPVSTGKTASVDAVFRKWWAAEGLNF